MEGQYREVKIGDEKVKVSEETAGGLVTRRIKVGWGAGNKAGFVFASIMGIIGWFSLFSSPVIAVVLIVLSLLWYRHIHKSIRKKSRKYLQIISEMERQIFQEKERQRNLVEAEKEEGIWRIGDE